jgi:very-short-patch-repair endonuclease
MGAPVKPSLLRQRVGAGGVRGRKGSKNDPEVTRTVHVLGGWRIKLDPDASTETRIGAIAERQRGRVARAQLLAAGIDRSAIFRRTHNGWLERVHSAVYALPNTADVPGAAEAAALLACGDGAVLSHHSAATLWGLRPGVARPVHVTIAGRRGCPALPGVTVHRSTTLTARDVRVRDGFPVTSPARTLIDVAATLTDRDVERLLDEALFVGRIVTRAEIHDALARAGHDPGRARLIRIAGNHHRSTKTDSPPEEELLKLIRAAALPEPETQAYVLGYRLDFYWPGLRLAVELDAYGTHGSRARFESDRRRDARLLTEKGIVVLRLTKSMIEQRPWEAIGVLARTIGQREAQGRAA